MLAGELYDALDEELSSERTNARLLLKKLNEAGADDYETVRNILRELIPNAGKDLWIQPPFFCDYGYNIEAGEKVFFNFNCVVLDVMKVSIGTGLSSGPTSSFIRPRIPSTFRKEPADWNMQSPS